MSTKTAYRILIAHTGDNLASQDVNEILKYAWDGQISEDVTITSHPLSPNAWDGFDFRKDPPEQFSTYWFMWQQMLEHQYGEHPYWDDHETHAYKGLITRTGQIFYTEIYYK